jgi:hypothetical protein
MKRRRWVLVVGVLLALAGLAGSTWAEVKFDYGASARLRQEIWDDVVSLSTLQSAATRDRNFFRLRYSLWGSVDIDKSYAGYLKLTGEPKYYIGPYKPNVPRNDDRLDEDELVIDNVYFEARNIAGGPVSVKIGRQDFLGPNTYGEGFLIMDGTPGDGSRTFYFNAAKINIVFAKEFNLDIVGIADTRVDQYLPSLHTDDSKKRLTGSNEQAVVVYGRGKIDSFTFEPYYIWKTEKAVSDAAAVYQSRLDLNTLGARLIYVLNEWQFGGEFAYQFGEYSNDIDRTGFGGYAFVTRKYGNVDLKPEWDVRYIYLSGDKPGTTDKNETWDPLFSRNPYWNELYGYTLRAETRQYAGLTYFYWTNLELIKAALKLNFTPETNLSIAYQYLWAPQKTSGLDPRMFSNDGHSRGHLPTALLYHKFSKNIDGFLQFEYFIPENFYSNNADDALFFRWQPQFKI